MSNISAIPWREYISFDEIIVHQQAELDFYIASSMRHYPSSVQPVFVPNPLYFVQQIPILYSVV